MVEDETPKGLEMLLSYKYRIYPNKKQKKRFEEILETCRILYNNALAERKEAYERNKASLTCYEQIMRLTQKRKGDNYLKRVHSQVLQDVLRRLDKAFQNFFRRVKNGEDPGYPKFKCKTGKRQYRSFTYPQSGYKIKDNRLHLSKIGDIKIKLHRPIEGEVKTLTIKRDRVGDWFAIFSVDIGEAPEKVEIKSEIGVDVGLASLFTLSNGDKIDHREYLRQSEKKLAKYQRRLSRKKRGSKNRAKGRIKVAKLHRKISRQREDYLHKESKKLVDNYDKIVFENLNIKGMVKNHHLAKSIMDAGWGKLIQFTTYKASRAGKWVELVAPHNTSQICSNCGEKVEKSLAQRTHRCPFCGFEADRDHNAALNILDRSTFGTRDRACGDSQ